MKVLITGFQPFGIIGKLFRINPSEIVAIRLSQQFKTDVLIMEVKQEGIDKLRELLSKNNYDLIFMLGYGGSFRIESFDIDGRENHFAKMIKSKIGYLTKENIGSFFCGKAYKTAMDFKTKSIFIHIPLWYDYDKIKEIFEECLKC